MFCCRQKVVALCAIGVWICPPSFWKNPNHLSPRSGSIAATHPVKGAGPVPDDVEEKSSAKVAWPNVNSREG